LKSLSYACYFRSLSLSSKHFCYAFENPLMRESNVTIINFSLAAFQTVYVKSFLQPIRKIQMSYFLAKKTINISSFENVSLRFLCQVRFISTRYITRCMHIDDNSTFIKNMSWRKEVSVESVSLHIKLYFTSLTEGS